jgi:hypothetical protein
MVTAVADGAIVATDWILNRIEFPYEYHWYRYSEIEIEITYQFNEDEIKEFPGYVDKYGRIFFSINIWKNNTQYFMQIRNDFNYTHDNSCFYNIDIEKLRKILSEMDFAI